MRVTIPITDYDLELLANVIKYGGPLIWSFDTDTGESIDIMFKSDTEDVVG